MALILDSAVVPRQTQLSEVVEEQAVRVVLAAQFRQPPPTRLTVRPSGEDPTGGQGNVS
jgi:hypothetical protein